MSKTLIHPNSRKAYQIAKSTTTEEKKLRRTKDRATKFDAIHSKLLWFKEQCDPGKETFTNEDVLGLIEKYTNNREYYIYVGVEQFFYGIIKVNVPVLYQCIFTSVDLKFSTVIKKQQTPSSVGFFNMTHNLFILQSQDF